MAEIPRKIIGENIRARRMALGLSQTDLGDAIGFERRFISFVERGQRSLPIDSYPRLAATLRINDPLRLFESDGFL